MSTTSQLTFYSDSAQGWERALYAFLGEKQRRSGSRRTVRGFVLARIIAAAL